MTLKLTAQVESDNPKKQFAIAFCREILKEEDEVQSNGKMFKKYHLGDYRWITFRYNCFMVTQTPLRYFKINIRITERQRVR